MSFKDLFLACWEAGCRKRRDEAVPSIYGFQFLRIYTQEWGSWTPKNGFYFQFFWEISLLFPIVAVFVYILINSV